MGKSKYVKTIAIIFVVFSSLGLLGSIFGLCYTKYLPSHFVQQGTAVPSSTYQGLYAIFGFLTFHYLLFLFLSTCLLVLNKDDGGVKKHEDSGAKKTQQEKLVK